MRSPADEREVLAKLGTTTAHKRQTKETGQVSVSPRRKRKTKKDETKRKSEWNMEWNISRLFLFSARTCYQTEWLQFSAVKKRDGDWSIS